MENLVYMGIFIVIFHKKLKIEKTKGVKRKGGCKFGMKNNLYFEKNNNFASYTRQSVFVIWIFSQVTENHF